MAALARVAIAVVWSCVLECTLVVGGGRVSVLPRGKGSFEMSAVGPNAKKGAPTSPLGEAGAPVLLR